MKNTLAALTVASIGLTGLAVPPAHSAALNVFSDLASFSAAAGGGPFLLQDFEGYADGTNLMGVSFLPGVSATTNMESLEAFFSIAAVNTRLFGTGGGTRAAGNAFYDIALSLPYKSIAFDIAAFEADPSNLSTAQGPGTLLVNFADATSQALSISGNLLGDPIFVGLVSDTAITSIRWSEALEGDGGNEETSLDDFRVAQVPEAGTLGLLGLALVGLAWTARRRRR